MSWTQICNASDVPVNTAKTFKTASGITLLMVNYGSGFRALPPVCPHMEEPLAESGVVANCILTCTKHLWAWNLVTLDKLGETEKPLQTYPVKVEGDAIFAQVEREIIYDFDEADDLDDDAFFTKG